MNRRYCTITLNEYKQLTQSEKIDLLHKEGVYIGKRMVGNFRVVLYQLESFYVEVLYKDYRRNISRLSFSQYTGILDPYLEQIDIEMLV